MKLFASIILVLKFLSIDCSNVDTNIQNCITVPKQQGQTTETLKNLNATITHSSPSPSHGSTRTSKKLYEVLDMVQKPASYADKVKTSLKETNKTKSKIQATDTSKYFNSTITHCSSSALCGSTLSSENMFEGPHMAQRKVSYAEKLKNSLKHTNKSKCSDRARASSHNICERTVNKSEKNCSENKPIANVDEAINNSVTSVANSTNSYRNTFSNASSTSRPSTHIINHNIENTSNETGSNNNSTSSNIGPDSLRIDHNLNNRKKGFPISNSKLDINKTNNTFGIIKHEMNEIDMLNVDIITRANQKTDNNVDVSMDKTIFNNKERVAIGLELKPDRPNMNNTDNHTLKSISTYDKSGVINRIENIVYHRYHPRENEAQAACEDNPHSIWQVQKKVKKKIENKVVIVNYAVYLLSTLNVEKIQLPLWYVRDVACLTKFIDILARSYYNSNNYKPKLDDAVKYLLNKNEQSYIQSISRTKADWTAVASWVLYNKFKIEWENDVDNLMNENNYQMDDYPGEIYKLETPHRGFHCDNVNKYTLRALSPDLGIYHSYIDLEIDANKKVKQVTFLMSRGETDKIFFSSSTHVNDTFHNNEPWLLKKRRQQYVRSNKFIIQNKILNQVKNNVFVVHQPATDFIKYRIISREILKKYSNHFVNLRALLRSSGIPAADSEANLKVLAKKYLHHEPNVELDGVARAAICGQLFKLYRFETKPKVKFYDWKSGEFALKID